MNRHIKSFLTFTGGAAVGLIFGGAGVIAVELSSERIRDGLKKALSDWIDERLFGVDPLKTEKKGSKRQKASYRNYYDNRVSFTDAIYILYADAERLRNELEKIADKYGVVTLSDYYDLAGLVDKNSFNAALYGWTKSDIREAEIKSQYDYCTNSPGYYVALPMPKKLPQ